MMSRVDYAERYRVQRYRVEVGAHPVAANAHQTEILHAKDERTIQMNLFLPSAVCHVREVEQHMRRRETHERYGVLELIT